MLNVAEALIGKQAGRQASRQGGRQAGKQASRQASKQAGKQAGRQAGKQASKQAASRKLYFASSIGSQQAKALPTAHCHGQVAHSLLGWVAILQTQCVRHALHSKLPSSFWCTLHEHPFKQPADHDNLHHCHYSCAEGVGRQSLKQKSLQAEKRICVNMCTQPTKL